jgi:hypothetical protein
MEYGFIACDHPRDEGCHSREDIFAGRWNHRRSASARSAPIAVRE